MVDFDRQCDDPDRAGFDPELVRFERDMRAGLQPCPAPEGFADRVLSRVDKLPRHGPRLRPIRSVRNPIVRGAIAAILLIAVGLGGYFEHQRQVAGEHARQQVLLALRIASFTLQDVRNKVDRGYTNHGNTN